MARFEVPGIEGLQDRIMRKEAAATAAIPKMLKAGGAVLVKAQQEEIRRTFTGDRSTGDLAASIKQTKIKKKGDAQCVEVYPHGKTRRGELNATVGFVQEYGRSNMPARPWFTSSNEKVAPEVQEAMRGHGRKKAMFDEVETLLKSTLAALCKNVARLVFKGKAGTYITYQLVLSQDRDAADDEMHGTEYTYRVDIYSKTDYSALLRRTKRALLAAGFYGIVIDPEVYESDTGYFHVPMEVKFYEKMEV